MTSRRLLHGLSLLALAALLCAFVVACGGGGDPSGNACPGWLRDEEKPGNTGGSGRAES